MELLAPNYRKSSEEEMKKHIKAFFIAVFILILSYVVGFFGINILMKIVVGHKNEVITPDLVNMSFDSAVQKCKKMKLYAQVGSYVNSKDIPKDKVISQDPHSGIKIKQFRTVKLVVSKGPELVRIPYLDNLTVSNAKLKLENAGLFLGKKKYQYSSVLPKGKIISSEPYADDLIPRGGKVDIIISLGKLKAGKSRQSKYQNLLHN